MALAEICGPELGGGVVDGPDPEALKVLYPLAEALGRLAARRDGEAVSVRPRRSEREIVRQSDVERAIRAARRQGVEISAVEVDYAAGVVRILVATPEQAKMTYSAKAEAALERVQAHVMARKNKGSDRSK